MIVNFACKDTASIFDGVPVKRIPRDLQQAAYNKLRFLSNAANIASLQVIPGLHCKSFQEISRSTGVSA